MKVEGQPACLSSKVSWKMAVKTVCVWPCTHVIYTVVHLCSDVDNPNYMFCS